MVAPEPPPGFDWRWYVRSYTDLAAAGIVDEKSAIRHWRVNGRREGRRFAPRRPSSFDWSIYVDRFSDTPHAVLSTTVARRPQLVCPSVDSIFLRAWGDLVCWDDAGSDRVLQAWDPAVDYAEIFLNGPFQEIRRNLKEGRMSWPEECSRCLLLRLPPDGAGAPWERTFVRVLRVEPSYYCSLDCPGCVPLSIRRRHSKAFQLDPEILARILADLTAGGLEVDALDFQGHGEPLLNPRLWEMARRSRERLPRAWISVVTNAQGRFRPEMAKSGLDEVVCAIDGADPASYEPYRVCGNFQLAWQFLIDFIRANTWADRPIRVVWKYVIFEHNSSPESLLKAQRMALDAGVSELVFVSRETGRRRDRSVFRRMFRASSRARPSRFDSTSPRSKISRRAWKNRAGSNQKGVPRKQLSWQKASEETSRGSFLRSAIGRNGSSDSSSNSRESLRLRSRTVRDFTALIPSDVFLGRIAIYSDNQRTSA